jgi:hypothetical protein
MSWGLGSLCDLSADLSLADAKGKIPVGFGWTFGPFVDELYAKGFVVTDQPQGAMSPDEVIGLVNASSALGETSKGLIANNFGTFQSSGFYIKRPASAASSTTAETVVANVSNPAGTQITGKLSPGDAISLAFASAGGVISRMQAQRAAQEIMKRQARGERIYKPSRITALNVALVVGGVVVLGLLGYVVFRKAK